MNSPSRKTNKVMTLDKGPKLVQKLRTRTPVRFETSVSLNTQQPRLIQGKVAKNQNLSSIQAASYKQTSVISGQEDLSQNFSMYDQQESKKRSAAGMRLAPIKLADRSERGPIAVTNSDMREVVDDQEYSPTITRPGAKGQGTVKDLLYKE